MEVNCLSIPLFDFEQVQKYLWKKDSCSIGRNSRWLLENRFHEYIYINFEGFLRQEGFQS